MNKVYVAIDLKSFYASCECVELGYDPLNTNLVVADQSRTEKTICLAVSPSLKSYGISGRARLFEVVQRVKEVNEQRQRNAPHRQLTDKSFIYSELISNPSLAVDYVVAAPQMAHYMKVSAQIYGIYLKYVAPEGIFAYSVDEVFIDATGYLSTYHTDGHGFARMLIQDVLDTTGIMATAGVGAGTAKRLETLHIYTMGDIARYSLDRYHIGKLYKLLGKNAELLIDHAWGIEPTTISCTEQYCQPLMSTMTARIT